MYSLLIKNARLFGNESQQQDIGINGDSIVKIGQGLGSEADKIIDAQGKLIIPGFVDIHTHLEKSMTSHILKNESGTLMGAIVSMNDFFAKYDPEDIYHRARQAAELAISQGTTAIRTHITIDRNVGLGIIRPILKLKEDLKDVLTIQVIAFPSSHKGGIQESDLDVLRQAISEGADLLGGCPHLEEEHKHFTDHIFHLAKELDVDLDLHVDESDEPNVDALEYVAEKTIEMGYQGRVNAGHCTALSAVPKAVADRVIGKVRDAGMTITTLPSCNLYLMGRHDEVLQRRGITRVREFLKAGVKVCFASDNVRDPFRPFGNHDLLEEALLTAQLVQMGTDKELETVLEMGTYNPAQAMKLPKYGLEKGCYADLVILDAVSAPEAIVKQSTKEWIIKRGRVVVRNTRTMEEVWKQV
ncbi:MAG TPA: amidohydrolase family protein [Clostridia bacterium]|nr:amidohydrolase family protein [Clostridia bacterium]